VPMIRRLFMERRGVGGSLPILNIVLLLVLAVFAVFLVARIAERGPGFFLQILVFGLSNGSIYVLIALGYTMVYGIIELINFAHGDVFTVGAFVSVALLPMFAIVEGRPLGVGGAAALVLVLILTMLFCGLMAVGIERVAYRPLRHAPRLAPLITAIGMSFVLQGILYIWKGPFTVHYPNVLPAQPVQIGFGANIGTKEIIVILVAAALLVALSFFVARTSLGRAMRATAQDRDAAQLMGIDIDRTIAATFFIGAFLAGAGGMIFGLYFNNVTFDLGFHAGLVAFTAAVFGGIGNIQGAALGALIIGIVQAFWDGYFDSAWTQVFIFTILILVLVFRPTGLLGAQVPEK
jgi:branched-chain amino acid transport system permease protein